MNNTQKQSVTTDWVSSLKKYDRFREADRSIEYMVMALPDDRYPHSIRTACSDGGIHDLGLGWIRKNCVLGRVEGLEPQETQNTAET